MHDRIFGFSVLVFVAGSVPGYAHDLELLDAAVESPIDASVGNATMTVKWHTGQDAFGNVYAGVQLQQEIEWTIGPEVTTLVAPLDLALFKFDRSRSLAFSNVIENATLWNGPSLGSIGLTRAHTSHNLVATPDGDFYIKGTFGEPTDFDPGAGEWILTPTAPAPLQFPAHYLAKYDSDGNLLWARLLYGGESVDYVAGNLAIPQEGGVIMALSTGSTIDADPGAGVHEIVVSDDAMSACALVKFAADGTFEEAHTFYFTVVANPNSYFPRLPSVYIDDTGVIYLESYLDYGVEVDLDPGPGVLDPSGWGDYRLKLNPDFSADYASFSNNQALSQIPDLNIGNLAFVDSGRLTIDAHSNSIYDLDPGLGTVFPPQPPDQPPGGEPSNIDLILQLTEDGEYVRHVQLFGIGLNRIHKISKAPNGDIFAAGEFSGILDFDPGIGEHIIESVNINPPYFDWETSDAFLWHLNSDLEFIDVYVVSGEPNIQTFGVHAFDLGDIWWHGDVWFAGSLDLDPTEGVMDILSGNEQTFISHPQWNFALWLGPPKPDVTAISRANPAATNASSVVYNVQFDEPVTGVDASDFVVVTGGSLTGTSVTSAMGSGSNYTVTVSTGTGDGELGLNLVDDDSIMSATNQPLSGKGLGNGDFVGETYTIDRTPPSASIDSPPLTITATGPVTFTVEYSDAAAIALVAGDVNLLTTGTATGTVSVLGSGLQSRTIVVDNISGTGTIGVSIDAGTAVDSVGNLSTATGPSATVTVDPSALAVNIGPPSAFIANAGPVTYTIEYDNAASVTLSESDITLLTTGSVSTEISVTGSGTAARTISFDNLDGEGTIAFSIASETASDGGSIFAPAAGPSAAFVADTVAPEVVGINAEPAKGVIQNYILSFSEPVTGVDVSDLSVRAATGVTGASIVGVSGPSPGAVYTVAVDTGSGYGPIVVAVEDNDTIIDLAGNPLGGPGIGNGSFNEGPAVLPIAGACAAALIFLALGVARIRRPTGNSVCQRPPPLGN